MSETIVRFNRAFAEANRTRCRYRLLCGGAGSGKSMNTAQDFILKLSDTRYRGANLLVVRKTEAACRYSVFEELVGAVSRIFGPEASRFWHIRQEPMELTSLVTGGRIIFRGMKDESQRERLKSVAFESGKLTWIWCEEATELYRADFDILDDRLRGDLSAINPALYYQITMTFNPISAGHWIKKRFWDAPPSPDVFLHHSTFRDNAFIGKEYAARMERRAVDDPEGYAVYALGEWGSKGTGLILTRWRVTDMDPAPEGYDSVWMAQDFGYNHADCLLLIGLKDGAICVLKELYVREKDTAEIIALAEEAGFPKNRPMYCDSAEPDRIRMWQKAGWRAMPVVKEPGSVASQIDYLKQHEIRIDPRCKNVIDEISAWQWMRDEATGEALDEPSPIHDDAMAALRYATEPLRRAERRIRTLPKNALGI